MRQLFSSLLKYHFIILFVLLEFFSFLFIANSSYYQKTRIYNSIFQFTGGIYQIFNNTTDYLHLRENNRLLAEENARLRAQIQESYVKLSNKEVFINDTIYRQQFNYVDAKIISNSIGKRNNYIILNKGFFHGIRNNMAVISSNGVVGIVNNVTANFSSIMSLLHSETKISAKIKKYNATGSVIWEGGSFKNGKLVDIPQHIKFNIGDTVVTSGFSLDFPEGIKIGTISEYSLTPGDNFYNITINFLTDFNKIDYVYIIKNLFKDEQLKLKESQHE